MTHYWVPRNQIRLNALKALTRAVEHVAPIFVGFSDGEFPETLTLTGSGTDWQEIIDALEQAREAIALGE